MCGTYRCSHLKNMFFVLQKNEFSILSLDFPSKGHILTVRLLYFWKQNIYGLHGPYISGRKSMNGPSVHLLLVGSLYIAVLWVSGLILWVSEFIPLYFGCLNLYFGCQNLYLRCLNFFRCTLGVWTYTLGVRGPTISVELGRQDILRDPPFRYNPWIWVYWRTNHSDMTCKSGNHI